VIDAGHAALVSVAGITHDDALITIDQAFAKANWKAEKQVTQELDVRPRDLDQAIRDGAREVG
jgi:hypothetical protein